MALALMRCLHLRAHLRGFVVSRIQKLKSNKENLEILLNSRCTICIAHQIKYIFFNQQRPLPISRTKEDFFHL